MELPVESSAQPSRGRNFEKTPWCYLLWGLPAVLVIGAGIAYGESILSLTARGIIWVVAVAWAGVGCFLNCRSSGRVHCRIDGIAFPLLALVGTLKVLSIVTFRLEPVWLAFFVILVGSFVPGWTWKKYSCGDMARADDGRNYPVLRPRKAR